jgi:hypothetical protein
LLTDSSYSSNNKQNSIYCGPLFDQSIEESASHEERQNHKEVDNFIFHDQEIRYCIIMIFKTLFTNYLYKSYELCKKGFVIFKGRGFVIFLARLLNFLWKKIYSKKNC